MCLTRGHFRSHTGRVHWAKCRDVFLSFSWVQMHFSHPSSHVLPTGWTTTPTTQTCARTASQHCGNWDLSKGGKWWIHRHTHVVWQAGRFRAAAVIRTGGRDETSSAGLGGVLTVTDTFKHIAALCLFHRQQTVCRAIGESQTGTLFFFAD